MPAYDLIHELAKAGVKQNVTAALANGPSSYVSVFAGRIADTGRDPMGVMTASVEMLRPYPQLELI